MDTENPTQIEQQAAPISKPRVVPNILVTGVPGAGKTTLSALLADQLNTNLNTNLGTDVKYFRHINTGEVIKQHNLYEGWDQKFDVGVFDPDSVVDHLEDNVSSGGAIVDFHTSDFFPERWFDIVVLLRVDNTILYDRLAERGYKPEKITENSKKGANGS